MPFLSQINTDGRLRHHYVYMMICQDEGGPLYIKFGRSGDISSRLSQLRIGCPIPVIAFGTVDAGPERDAKILEKLLHRAYGPSRVRGEWFKFDRKCPEEKKFFNETWKAVFAKHFGSSQSWSIISVKELDKSAKTSSIRFLKSNKGKRQLRRQAHERVMRGAFGH